VPRAALILASASPRRARLLTEAGLAFAVEPSEVQEDVESSWLVQEAAEALAERKARAVAQAHVDDHCLVLGADTIVVLGEGDDELLLGKPDGEEGAKRMLESLSGTRHRVVTGVSVVRTRDGVARTSHEQTWVTMRPISPAEVEAYVASGEWIGKAGGYAIQETADAFVESLEGGGFDNVVGLPVNLALGLLAALELPA
jgi:septum formation protein